MFKLLRHFSLTSAVAILAVTVVLVILYRHNAMDDLVDIAERQNVALARSFANTIWPQYSPYVGSVPGLDGDALRARPETRQIHEALMTLTAGLPVLKVKIYNLDGLTVFSSQASQMGEDKSNNRGFFAAARAGRPASKMVHKEKFSAFSGEVVNRDLVESYLPIRRGDGPVEGVFELYLDVTPLIGEIERSTRRLVIGFLLIFGVLYGALFLIVRRADRILKRQYVDVLRGEERIAAKNAALEREIIERTQAERALRESEERFRAVVDHSPAAISLKDTEGRYLLANKRYEGWFGINREDIAGKTFYDLYPLHRADILSAQDRKALATGAVSERTAKRVFADGTTHTVLITKFPVPGSDGKPVAICGIHTDITERILLQEQLAAAQKMEALGQLTGGVAHEFNNLLMVIAANLQLLEEEVEGMESPTRRVQKALKTAFKGGELTQHMLSYVGRQALSPKVIDVYAFVADTVQMLRPMVGETIAIETVTGDDIWPVSVDPGGLDSALLNLVINARDALPDGGKITIETANLRVDEAAAARRPYKVVPGDYVMLAVVDNGTGMTPDVAERAFDPFFTTKDIGKGTGLGLSRVFGFVRRQSGGYIDIESAPRRGTTVRLYLPRVQAGAGETPEPAEATEEPVRGGATVLVVEDDTEVLGATVELLEKLGYRVFYANNGRDALTLSEKADRIDLLLTDVVMPGGINGVELAQAIRRTRPAIRVIFMSGYPDEATAAEGVPESGAPLLRKPFKTGELAQVINEVLEGGKDQRTMCA